MIDKKITICYANSVEQHRLFEEGDEKMDLMVCVGSSCHLQNSRDLIARLKDLITQYNLEDTVELKGSFAWGIAPRQVYVSNSRRKFIA